MKSVQIYFDKKYHQIGTIISIFADDSDRLVRRLIIKVEETEIGYLYWLVKD